MGECPILMLAQLAVVIIMSVPVVSVDYLVLLLFLILFIVDVVLLALTCARSTGWKGGGDTRAGCRWSHLNLRIETNWIVVVLVSYGLIGRSPHIEQQH